MLGLSFTVFHALAESMIYFLNIKVRRKPYWVHFLCGPGDRLVSHAVNYCGKYPDVFSPAV